MAIRICQGRRGRHSVLGANGINEAQGLLGRQRRWRGVLILALSLGTRAPSILLMRKQLSS